MTAGEAESKVDPCIADLHTVLAEMLVTSGDPDFLQVIARAQYLHAHHTVSFRAVRTKQLF
jgi:hypothetical protein